VTTTTPAALAQSTDQLRRRALDALRTCGVDTTTLPGTGRIDVRSPVTGGVVATLTAAGPGEVEAAIEQLADLIGVEVGKIASEALGEIQEMIDICDYAVGLSRQLEGPPCPRSGPGTS
jgi:acyl-CoA reductase-like NAD-dependent aldehyde dehydrogenase